MAKNDKEALLRIRLTPTLVLSALASVWFSMPDAGFLMIFVAPGLAIWLPFALIRAYRKPALRRVTFFELGIWIVALGISTGVQIIRHEIVRHRADRIVATLETFHAEHGRYPSDLTRIGVSQRQLRAQFGLAGYLLSDGKPAFFYAATFIPFDTWYYDFNRHAWIYKPD